MALRESELLYTLDKYLAFERASESRHEYVDGYLYEMSGESLAHGDISMNLSGILYNQLRGTPCRALSKDTKIRSGPLPHPRRIMKGMFSYPDLVVVCGRPQFHDDYQDIILNPTVIIEVLSPSTEDFDRSGKFTRYRKFSPTLTDYLLVAQDVPLIDHYQRQADDSWLLRTVQGLEREIQLPALGCVLRLSEIYDRVEFLPLDEADDAHLS